MRPSPPPSLPPFGLSRPLFLGNPSNHAAAGTVPLAERLVGTWTCHAQENDATIAMTLDYHRRNGWLVGEFIEDDGAAMLDVWPGWTAAPPPLALRRLLSYDATVEMQPVEEGAGHLKLEGAMHFFLGNAGAVRGEIRFTGNDRFEALREAEVDKERVAILSRSS